MAGRKSALLIGIRTYPNIPPSFGRSLEGCHNDVEILWDALAAQGFDDLRVLVDPIEKGCACRFCKDPSQVDALPTRQGIRDAVDAWIRETSEEDVVVFYYSGHGSELIGRGTDAGKRFQTFVPFDSGRGESPNRDLADREIMLWIERLNARTPNVTLIFDCCYSGGLTGMRGEGELEGRQVAACTGDPAELLAGSGLEIEPGVGEEAGAAAQTNGEVGREGASGAERDEDLVREHEDSALTRSGSGWLWRPGRSAVVLSACAAGELSSETLPPPDALDAGKPHGLFTYNLVRSLRGLDTEELRWSDIFADIASRVTRENLHQHPRREGDGPLLAPGEIDPRDIDPPDVVDLKKLAVVIGIDYQPEQGDASGDGPATGAPAAQNFPPLRAPVKDAEAVAQALCDPDVQGYELVGLSRRNPKPLLGARATRRNIHRLIHRLARIKVRSAPAAAVVIYFAGHGVVRANENGERVGYLIPADANRDDPSTWLPMRDLRDQLIEGIRDAERLAALDLDKPLERLTSRHLLLILDCCFGGALADGFFRGDPPERPIYFSEYRRFVEGRAWHLLSSAASDEQALDRDPRDPGQEHSPFAAALLEGLRTDRADTDRIGGRVDRIVTANELYAHIDTTLRASGVDIQTPGLLDLRPNTGQFIFRVPGFRPTPLPDPVLDATSNPWQGEKPYEAAHQNGEEHQGDALFFGRETAILRMLQAWGQMRCRGLAVVGGSGSGKTSLVRAGFLPILRNPVAGRRKVLRDLAKLGESHLLISAEDLAQVRAWIDDQGLLGLDPPAMAAKARIWAKDRGLAGSSEGSTEMAAKIQLRQLGAQSFLDTGIEEIGWVGRVGLLDLLGDPPRLAKRVELWGKQGTLDLLTAEDEVFAAHVGAWQIEESLAAAEALLEESPERFAPAVEEEAAGIEGEGSAEAPGHETRGNNMPGDEVPSDGMPGAKALRAAHPHDRRGRLALWLDGLEAILKEPEAAARLGRLLETGRVRVLATARSKVGRLAGQCAAVRDGWWHDFSPPLPTRAELREMVVGPAAARVLFLDPPSLVDDLVEELHELPASVALISLTLSDAYLRAVRRRREEAQRTDSRFDGDRRILSRDLPKGGVAGLLERRAEEVYAKQTKHGELDLVRWVFVRTLASEGRLLTRRVPKSELELPDKAAQKSLMESVLPDLLGARVLISRHGCLEVTHEGLLQAWPRLRDWRSELGSRLAVLRSVGRRAHEWQASGRELGKLWDHDSVIRDLLEAPELDRLERDFVVASDLARRARLAREIAEYARGDLPGGWNQSVILAAKAARLAIDTGGLAERPAAETLHMTLSRTALSVPLPVPGEILGLAFLDGGKRLGARIAGGVLVWDLADLGRPPRLEARVEPPRGQGCARAERRDPELGLIHGWFFPQHGDVHGSMASIDRDGCVRFRPPSRLLSPPSERPVALLGHRANPTFLAFSRPIAGKRPEPLRPRVGAWLASASPMPHVHPGSGRRDLERPGGHGMSEIRLWRIRTVHGGMPSEPRVLRPAVLEEKADALGVLGEIAFLPGDWLIADRSALGAHRHVVAGDHLSGGDPSPGADPGSEKPGSEKPGSEKPLAGLGWGLRAQHQSSPWIWDLRSSWPEATTWDGQEAPDSTFLHAGKAWLVWHEPGPLGNARRLRLWDLGGHRVELEMPPGPDFPGLPEVYEPWEICALSADGKVVLGHRTEPPERWPEVLRDVLLAGSGPRLRVWDSRGVEEPKVRWPVLPEAWRTPMRLVTAISPDGAWLAMQVAGRSQDGEGDGHTTLSPLLLWQTERLEQPPLELPLFAAGENASLDDLLFCPDSCWLAAMTWRGRAGLWSLAALQDWAAVNDGTPPPMWSPPETVARIAFSRAGIFAMGTEHGDLGLRDLEGGELSLQRGFPGRVLALAISADGQRVAVGTSDGVVRVWRPVELPEGAPPPPSDAPPGPPWLPVRLGGAEDLEIRALAFDANGDCLAVARQLPGSPAHVQIELHRLEVADLELLAGGTAGRRISPDDLPPPLRRGLFGEKPSGSRGSGRRNKNAAGSAGGIENTIGTENAVGTERSGRSQETGVPNADSSTSRPPRAHPPRGHRLESRPPDPDFLAALGLPETPPRQPPHFAITDDPEAPDRRSRNRKETR